MSGDSKQVLKDKANALVNPVTREANEAAAAATEKTARDQLDSSLAGAANSLNSCADGTKDMATLAQTARTAMRSHDAARRMLGNHPLFGDADFQAIPITGDAVAIKKGCREALHKLIAQAS